MRMGGGSEVGQKRQRQVQLFPQFHTFRLEAEQPKLRKGFEAPLSHTSHTFPHPSHLQA